MGILIGETMSGVPVEFGKRSKSGGIGRPKEQLREKMESLNIGESFVVKFDEKDNRDKVRERISSTRTHVTKSKSFRFAVRLLEDRFSFGVWRIE